MEGNKQEYEYMLLDRLKTDCDYFLGKGNRNEKQLWAGNVGEQIAKMKELYNKLVEKPEWLTMEDIENYEKEMTQEKIQEVKKTLDDVYSDSTTEALWDEKFNELVPEDGNANTDIGEIMRCFASMSHAYLQNGEIIQNMQGSYLDDVEDLYNVLKRFGDPTLKTLFDKMDLTRSKTAYDHYMAEFYEYFVNTYLKDNKEQVEEAFEEPSLEITVSRAFNKADGKVPETIDFNGKTYKQTMVMTANTKPNENTVVYYTGNDVNSSDDYFYVTYTLNKVGENSYKGVENIVEVVDCTDGNPVVVENKEIKTENTQNAVDKFKEINVSTFEELREEIDKLLETEVINEEYEDILDIISDKEEACEDYINRRSDVTNTDWKDELYIEGDYVTDALKNIIELLNNNQPVSECNKVETKEILTEGTEQWQDITEEDVQLFMNTWGNYNEYGADADRVNGGWMSLDKAEEWLQEHSEEECFINDTDFPEQLNIEVSDYSNPQDIIDNIRAFIDCDDQESLNAIIEATGYSFDECLQILESGNFIYLPDVDNDYDLGKAYIDNIYGEEHLADIGRETLLSHIDEKEWAEEIERSLRDNMDDEPSEDMIQGLLDEEIENADDEVLAQHFDYESYGRDMDYSGWTFVSTGAIQTF